MTHSINVRYLSVVASIVLSQGLLACGDADEPPRDDISIDAQGLEEVKRLTDVAVAAGIPGVSVAILRDGQTVTFARGVASRQTQEPATPQHRFRTGSVAKSFTASLVLQLVDEGKLALSDTLERWLPGMLPASKDVTVEQLLRQESGIFDFAADERHMAPYLQGDMDFQWRPEELVALAADHPPDFEPGTRWAYSNTNYTLLALIVEKIGQKRLQDLAQARIMRPLGLEHSDFEVDSDMAAPFMRGYLVGQGDPLDVTRISDSAVFGNGNLTSTPLDMAHFYRALITGHVVSPRLLPQMTSLDPAVPSHYAMGLFRFDSLFSCGTFIGHDGQTPGYDNVAYTTLDGRRQVVVSVSSSTADDKAGDEAAHRAFANLVDAAGCL